jgi:hypothetical protein
MYNTREVIALPKRIAGQTPSKAPLIGRVQMLGVRPTIPADARAAVLADLTISFSGGVKGSTVTAKITVTLNTRVGTVGAARLIDESDSRTQPGAKLGNAYVFENVQFPAPGSVRAARRFRITNLRANASVLGGGIGPTPVLANVAVTASTPVRLSNAEQSVAIVQRG